MLFVELDDRAVPTPAVWKLAGLDIFLHIAVIHSAGYFFAMLSNRISKREHLAVHLHVRLARVVTPAAVQPFRLLDSYRVHAGKIYAIVRLAGLIHGDHLRPAVCDALILLHGWYQVLQPFAMGD